MAESQDIPPPLYEQFDSEVAEVKAGSPEEVLLAKYKYFDDRPDTQEPGG